jgi:aminoglycoside phosphotransferase (APT) family kinase protein
MHADEVDTNVSLVRRLLKAQFPDWGEHPIQPVPSTGTDNALYRLGDDMVVRLPRIYWAVEQVEKEQRWLPKLASHLPLAIPFPLAKGMPGEGYPWDWSIYSWLEGETSTLDYIADPCQMAKDLAQFIAALQKMDPADGPAPGTHNSSRGVPLAIRDHQTREAITSLGGTIDAGAVTAAWDSVLQEPGWGGPPVWIHGDLQSGNFLYQDGKLSAIIDFGCLSVGDPACDLMVAWNFFSGHTREVFRSALEVDAATWARGRGWALSVGLIALPYYRTTNPELAGIAQYAIDEVLAEHNEVI